MKKIPRASICIVIISCLLMLPDRNHAMTLGGFEVEIGEGENIFEDFYEEASPIEDPITEEPIIETPIIEAPIIEAPIVNEPIINEPIINDSITNDPIISEPITNDPVINDPIINEPIINESINEGTLTEEEPVKKTAADATPTVTQKPAKAPSPTAKLTSKTSKKQTKYDMKYQKLTIKKGQRVMFKGSGPVKLLSVRIDDKESLWEWKEREIRFINQESEGEISGKLEILYFIPCGKNVNFYVDE